MIRHILDLSREFEDRLERSLKQREDERERTAALLRDTRERCGTPIKDILAKHARGWLLIVHPGPSGLVTHLVPVVEAWIEHEFPLNHDSNGSNRLRINVRAEEGGLHLRVLHETSNIEKDTIDWPQRAWYTFMKNEGLETTIDGHYTLLSYHQSEEEAIKNSGIEKTYDDQQQTTYDHPDVRRELSTTGRLLRTEAGVRL